MPRTCVYFFSFYGVQDRLSFLGMVTQFLLQWVSLLLSWGRLWQRMWLLGSSLLKLQWFPLLLPPSLLLLLPFLLLGSLAREARARASLRLWRSRGLLHFLVLFLQLHDWILINQYFPVSSYFFLCWCLYIFFLFREDVSGLKAGYRHFISG